MMRRLSVMVVCCLTALPLLQLKAQSTFAVINGSVKDVSGTPVPGAHVEVRNIDENTVRTAEVSSDGLYEVLNLVPGDYEVDVSKAGFSDFKIERIHLDARQVVRADVELRVASVHQTVEVTSGVPTINTENATIAETKTSQQVTELPVNYRGRTTSPLSAILTVPGVTQDTAGNISVAGAMPAQAQYSLDGVSTTSVRSNGPISDMYPSSEMLSEFRVTEVDNSAEFAQMGDVTVITKSGTNLLHGSGFWYFQNAALDATTYGAPTKPHKVFNTFGGALSGPVIIPKLYNGHDRTFFFIDYEGNREPLTSLAQALVPSAAFRSGNLNGLPGPAVVDPTTGAPFPNNTIPSSRINPVATKLLSYYPLPNYNSSVDNYRVLVPTPSSTDGYDIRIDHVISSNQQLFGRWSWKDIPFAQSNGAILPPDEYKISSRNLILSHNYAIRPTLLNEFRFGISLWTEADHFPLNGTSVVTNLGLQGLDLSGVPAGSGGFPQFDFSDGTGFTPVSHGRDGPTASNEYQIVDNLSWIKGRHSMKFGPDIQLLEYRAVLHYSASDDFGGFIFSSDAFSGNAFADFLLGLPATTNYAVESQNLDQKITDYEFYGQDEWRVSDRFTLSYGLRYEIHPPMTEASGNISNFNPANLDVIVPDKHVPNAPGFVDSINLCPGTVPGYPCTNIVTASQAGLPQGLRRIYYGNWDPRLGVAYRPFRDNRTVIRAGAGTFTETVLGPTAYALTGIAGSDFRTYNNFQGAGQPPLFSLPQVKAGSFAVGSVGSEDFQVGTDLGFKDPRSYQWNFTIEHQLQNSTTLRLSYIGSESQGLDMKADLNQVRASTTPYSPARTFDPDFGQLYLFYNLGFVSYNALEAEMSHRFEHGLYYQASYTFSRDIGNAGGATGGGTTFPGENGASFPTDIYNTRLDRGNLPYPPEHRFLFTGEYDLPFGRGRTFGANMNRAADLLLGGWNLTTVTLIQTGPWLTPTISAALDHSNTNMLSRGVKARPDRIGSGYPVNQTPDDYFDVSAFTATPAGCGCFGNSGVGILEGPGTIAIAGGLAKNFAVTERLRLRLEATFTNLPNHPNFAPPAMVVSTPSTFGKLTSVQTQENSGNRTGQLAARFDF